MDNDNKKLEELNEIQNRVSIAETTVNYKNDLSLTLSGRLELKDIKISNDFLKNEKVFIEQVFTKVFNAAIIEAKRVHQEIVTEGLLEIA